MKIQSVTYALPSKKVTNEDLIEEIIEKNRKHLSSRELRAIEVQIKRFFKMSGTLIRYHRNKGERAIDFAMKAGREALKKAGIDASEVDLLIYAGVGRGWVEPATANLFQSELGLKSATCFDVMDACASWIRSISIAKSFLAQKIHRLVMVLNCEFNFREYANFEIKNTQDLENSFSAFTIGEAATATILTSDDLDDDSDFSFKTSGEKHELCKIALPNAQEFSPKNGLNGIKPMSFFTVPGELLDFTIKHIVQHFSEAKDIGAKVHDIIIGHAASVASTFKVINLLNLDPNSVFETHSRFGNTVSASLPLGLAVAESEGKLQRGMRVLMIMGSAGVTSGLGSFKY